MSISNSQKRNFLNEYRECFGEVGTLPKVHHITINQNIKSVVTPARKIPIALLDKLKLELERMRRLDTIEPVNESIEWVNPLIIVEKPNGKLRICLNPKHLDQAIKGSSIKDVRTNLGIFGTPLPLSRPVHIWLKPAPPFPCPCGHKAGII